MSGSDLHSFVDSLFMDRLYLLWLSSCVLGCHLLHLVWRHDVSLLGLFMVTLLSKANVFFCAILLLLSTPLILANQFLNVHIDVKVFVNRLNRELFIEDKAMVVLVEAIDIDTHETEKFGVSRLLRRPNPDVVGEYLREIHGHFVGFLIK